MGSLANSSSLQTTIKMKSLPLPLSAFSQLSLLTLKPSPRLRLMPTMVIMDMAWPTTGTVMVWLITVTTVLMPTLMLTDTTTARGPLMLSPRLRLMLTMVVMDMAWPTTTVMVWLITVTVTVMLTLMLTDTTTARGLLMLSPLLTRTTDITTDMLHTVMLTGVTTATLTLTVATTDTDIITK